MIGWEKAEGKPIWESFLEFELRRRVGVNLYLGEGGCILAVSCNSIRMYIALYLPVVML